MSDKQRTDRVSVRFTAAERSRLGTAAMIENRTVSDYMRLAALKVADELLGKREGAEREGKVS